MKLKSFIIITFAAFVGISFVGCSSEPITPEVTVSEGTVNYFSESMDFPSNGGSKILNFTSNVKWSLKVSETQNASSWCTVSQSEGSAGTYNIYVTVAENASYDDRNVVLVLTAGELTKNVIVNQKQKNALTLTTDRFEVGQEGGSIDVEIESNINYDVEIPEEYKNWISQKPQTRALSSKKLSFVIAESKEYDKREGRIIISSGDLTETVKVYQSGSAILVLSKNEYTLGSDGGTISIDISSNFEYAIDMPDVDWISSAPKTRAVSSHTLTYYISANSTYDDREAVIVFKDTKTDKKESVSIKQRQKDAIILSNKKVEISQDGGTFAVDVNSNVDYSIEMSSSCSNWISRITPPNAVATRSLSKSTPYFKVSNSEQYDKRKGEIYFRNNDVADTLTVFQSGGAILVLSKSEYNLEGEATTITVDLKSNIDYTVSVSSDWITERSTRAVSNSTKYFDIALNKTGKSRTGKIRFTTSDGSKSATVNVTQATIVEAQSLNISPSSTFYAYVGDNYTLYVKCTPSNAVVDYEWSSSNTDVLTINGNGSKATAKVVGYGEATLQVIDRNSGVSEKWGVHSRLSGFSWNNTGETYYGYYPMVTMAVGETQKLPYSSDQGNSIRNIFGNYKDFVFYEPTYVVSEPSVVSIDSDGNVTALKVGTVGIKPLYFSFAENGNERIYINVIQEYTEKEDNDDFSHANTIKEGQKMKFDLLHSGDIDVFKFTRPTQYFNVKVTYHGDLGGASTGTRILSYNLYNSSYELMGIGNLSFDANGGVYTQRRWLNTTQGYIRFYMADEYKQYFTPNGFFTVEFVPDE